MHQQQLGLQIITALCTSRHRDWMAPSLEHDLPCELFPQRMGANDTGLTFVMLEV